MNRTPQQGSYNPEHAIARIADFIADKVEAAAFPQTILRFRNDRWAADVGLEGLSDADWLAHFGRFSPLPDAQPQPLALRYHGHQFRVYNRDIGDGRGFLFAQLRDSQGRLLDLGTKGSGQTPYSRFGDGRLTLKGAVREILATEMLEALGVETSKTFSVIETGEALHRGDEPSPTRSAVMVRLNHGHIRIGSFQRLATLEDHDSLRRLAAYALEVYHNETPGEDAPVRLMHHVVNKTARLAAQFIMAGFVHGVLNSDNINISGESFDYGPWRFAPTFNPGLTAAYFDESGLYAYGRQPEAIHWDVLQLAVSLLGIAEEDALVAELNRFGDVYQDAIGAAFCWRLGVVPFGDARDHAMAVAFQNALYASQLPLDQAWQDWRGGMATGYDEEAFAEFRTLISAYVSVPGAKAHDWWQEGKACSMIIDEVEAIWAPIAQDDDWSLLTAKIAEVRRMGEALRSVG